MVWIVGRRDGELLVVVGQFHHVQRHVRLFFHALDEFVRQFVSYLEIAGVGNNRDHVQPVFNFFIAKHHFFHIVLMFYQMCFIFFHCATQPNITTTYILNILINSHTFIAELFIKKSVSGFIITCFYLFLPVFTCFCSFVPLFLCSFVPLFLYFFR